MTAGQLVILVGLTCVVVAVILWEPDPVTSGVRGAVTRGVRDAWDAGHLTAVTRWDAGRSAREVRAADRRNAWGRSRIGRVGLAAESAGRWALWPAVRATGNAVRYTAPVVSLRLR